MSRLSFAFSCRGDDAETCSTSLDILDIKPVNMEELTEVITAAEFHPISCNLFCYSSSKGTVKLADMRDSALCDKHSKRAPLSPLSLCC